MSRMGERAIMVANGEACPHCLQVYPVASEQDVRDHVNTETTPFHALGKPRHLDPGYHEAKRRLVQEWTWVQPRNQAELLQRLAAARDLDVHPRERENLCACAVTEITRLQREIAAWG